MPNERFFGDTDDRAKYDIIITDVRAGTRVFRFPRHSHYLLGKLYLEARAIAASRAAKDYLQAFADYAVTREGRGFCRRVTPDSTGPNLGDAFTAVAGRNVEAMQAVTQVLDRPEWSKWRKQMGDTLGPIYPEIPREAWYGS